MSCQKPPPPPPVLSWRQTCKTLDPFRDLRLFLCACVVCFLLFGVCAFLAERVDGNSRLLRGLQYVMEGLLAALLNLVDAGSEEGRRQLPAYRVSGGGKCSGTYRVIM